MDVKEVRKDEWGGDFVTKEKEADTYPVIGYSVVNVEKQKCGDYKGIIINDGGSAIRIR
ncbi:MAG: hypothetical protein ABF633_04970 [Clostridium sp.]|uniref:hypothetical protein n=1 Tax=Clostridium sp. TaxID=1506 RepID=UPI0039E9D44F